MVEIVKYEFELGKLQNNYNKLCPCLVKVRKNFCVDNLCPCKEFVETGKCRCGLFKEVE